MDHIDELLQFLKTTDLHIRQIKKHIGNENPKDKKKLLKFIDRKRKALLKLYVYVGKYVKKGDFKKEKLEKLFKSCKASIEELIDKELFTFDNKQEEKAFFGKMEDLENRITGKIESEFLEGLKKSGEIKSPSMFFKRDPSIEHCIYKDWRVMEEVSSGSAFSFNVPDWKKINSLYVKNGKKPYTLIHNHPIGSMELVEGMPDKNLLAKRLISIPSYGDFEWFLRNTEEETTEIHQHAPTTNQTEGVYIIRKTEDTPDKGIGWSTFAKDFESQKAAIFAYVNDKKLRERYTEFDKRAFTVEEEDEFLSHYWELSHDSRGGPKNLEHEQELLDKVAEKFGLQIEYLPAKGFYYEPGKGFLKNRNKV